jgi:hypothetical protein
MAFRQEVPTVEGWYNACVGIFWTVKRHVGDRRGDRNEEMEIVIRESFRM